MPNLYETICYEKSFLKEVVVRIDFPSLPNDMTTTLPKTLENAIIANFPIPEPRTAQVHEVLMSETTVQTSRTETKEWVFHGKDRDKTLIVGCNYFTLSIKKYKNYENLLSDIKAPLDALYQHASAVSANRIGLRYINVIESKKDSNPLNWKGQINKDMLALLNLQNNGHTLSRVFSVLEFNVDGLMLKSQFGIPNPDYPAPIKQKQFVIDLDAYVFGSFSREEINTTLGSAHFIIQDFFEKSITDKVRNIMKKQSV